MDDRRLELQAILERILGSRNVYYRPPESVKFNYPCIKYTTNDIQIDKANNSNYRKMIRYQIIVVSKTPDHPVINEILSLPYSSYDRYYAADNLNHDVLTLYF